MIASALLQILYRPGLSWHVAWASLLVVVGCFSPREGYYPFKYDQNFVNDGDRGVTTEPCYDTLHVPGGAWVLNAGRRSFDLVFATTCSPWASDTALIETGLAIPCELDGRSFACGHVEESRACYDTSDTARPVEPYDSADMTEISYGAAIRGEWTSRKAFEAQFSSWKIDYNLGSGPCDDAPAVDEWANVYHVYSHLHDQ